MGVSVTSYFSELNIFKISDKYNIERGQYKEKLPTLISPEEIRKTMITDHLLHTKSKLTLHKNFVLTDTTTQKVNFAFIIRSCIKNLILTAIHRICNKKNYNLFIILNVSTVNEYPF